MKTIFKVNEINFIDDENEQNIFSFLPATGLEKKIDQIDLLHEIFNNDIEITPQTEVTEIIQQLIDHNPQPETKAEVAQILSLYNPDDISAIVKSLIAAKCKTADDINEIIKSYPYELNSAIFDYKYLNWIALGDGTITRTDEKYYFNKAGVRIANIFPATAAKIRIVIDVYTTIETGIQPIFFLYTSTNGEETLTPHFALSCNGDTFRYIIQRRSTNNGTIINGTEYSYTLTDRKKLEFIKNTDGTVQLYSLDSNPKELISEISSSSSFNPRSIRINFGKGYGVTTTSNTLTINQFLISVNDTVVSKWNKKIIYP